MAASLRLGVSLRPGIIITDAPPPGKARPYLERAPAACENASVSPHGAGAIAMSILGNVRQASALMHTLRTADVVPNTFGSIGTIRQCLERVLAMLPANNVRAALGQEAADRLEALLTDIEDNRLVFAIPETWLVNQVMTAVERLRERLQK
jgi:hypothetical protein